MKGDPKKALAFMEAFYTLKQSPDPVAAFSRGITSNMIGNSVSWSAFFVIKDRTEQQLLSLRAARTSTSINSMTKADLTGVDIFVSSSVAGFATQVITNPVWVVKTRMLTTNRSAYPTTLSTFTKIYQKEGFKSFYSGFWISLVAVGQGGLQFVIYDGMKNQYRKRDQGTEAGRRDEGQEEEIPWYWTGLFSTVAKVTSVTAVYPYQVIRSRMQVDNAAAKFGKGLKDVTMQLMREAGIKGFYRGLMPAAGRSLPATWVTFMVYEGLRPKLRKYFDDDEESGPYRAP